eukprot:TRINITY_DN2809_c0_g1_i1.p1 TRINITY_DN2809_c0_g1~~TRINITY_DN2809_c0_g1_i1.p1  ORF type:complete len:390 (+),score=108.85 TRINITY_DN2809_c0_g1_i1:28-1197(+)
MTSTVSTTTSTKKRILVTGGTGYIGSHTVVEMLQAGYDITIVDNLVNSSEKVLERVESITKMKVTFHKIDLCDYAALSTMFQSSSTFDAVIHFAGLKAVGESVQIPLRYYDNNITGTLNLLKCMDAYNCRNLIFSSSACVYGDPEKVPIVETARTNPTNPYGRTKLMIEDICRDLVKSAKANWRIILLRYFNPIGAHSSGLIGEDPCGIPNNVGPYIAQVAVGRRPYLTIYGDDWPTLDGTGVRDYIHVIDLAQGHLAALANGLFAPIKKAEVKETKEKESKTTTTEIKEEDALLQPSYCEIINLGTGCGYSVKQLLAAFSKAAGKTLQFKIGARRGGDIAVCYADSSKAKKLLHWGVKLSLEKACADHLNWQLKNPNGFALLKKPSSS